MIKYIIFIILLFVIYYIYNHKFLIHRENFNNKQDNRFRNIIFQIGMNKSGTTSMASLINQEFGKDKAIDKVL